MTTREVIDALPPDLGHKAVSVTRASFRGKQDALEVFQLLWEPEDSPSIRIGDSSLRNQKMNLDQLSGIPHIDQPAQRGGLAGAAAVISIA